MQFIVAEENRFTWQYNRVAFWELNCKAALDHSVVDGVLRWLLNPNSWILNDIFQYTYCVKKLTLQSIMYDIYQLPHRIERYIETNKFYRVVQSHSHIHNGDFSPQKKFDTRKWQSTSTESSNGLSPISRQSRSNLSKWVFPKNPNDQAWKILTLALPRATYIYSAPSTNDSINESQESRSPACAWCVCIL